MKLFASDLDGTLLNENFGISPANIRAVQKLMDNNIIFVVATGRIFHDAMTICRNHQLRPYVISNNGACVFDGEGNQIYGGRIELPELRKIINILEELNVCYGIGDSIRYAAPHDWEQVFDGEIARLRENNIHIPKEKVIFTKYEMTAQNGFCTTDIESELDSGLLSGYSISVVTYDQEKTHRIVELIGQFPGLTATIAGSHSLEIMRRDGTKGDALRFLAEMLGLECGEIGAIGDSLNDITMLQYAGISVAMGNAREEVKKIGSFITKPCLEDGFASAVEALLDR